MRIKSRQFQKILIFLGSSTNSKIAAIECLKSNIYGLQFHPEVTHTSIGKKILHNF